MYRDCDGFWTFFPLYYLDFSSSVASSSQLILNAIKGIYGGTSMFMELLHYLVLDEVRINEKKS